MLKLSLHADRAARNCPIQLSGRSKIMTGGASLWFSRKKTLSTFIVSDFMLWLA